MAWDSSRAEFLDLFRRETYAGAVKLYYVVEIGGRGGETAKTSMTRRGARKTMALRERPKDGQGSLVLGLESIGVQGAKKAGMRISWAFVC